MEVLKVFCRKLYFVSSRGTLPLNLVSEEIRYISPKFLEKIREKGLTIRPGIGIMIERHDRRNYVCTALQTAMKPEIAAKSR